MHETTITERALFDELATTSEASILPFQLTSHGQRLFCYWSVFFYVFA